MSGFTGFAGLLYLDPGDPLSTEGFFFTSLNPQIIDRLLRVGAVTHRHDAHAAMANPVTAPVLTLTPTGGAIPADTAIYVAYTLLDADGGETAPVTLAPQTTASGYNAPLDVPVAVPDYTAGNLLANTYLYAATVTDGQGGETTIGAAAQVVVAPGYPHAQVDITGMTQLTNDASNNDVAAGWRLWRQVNGGPWYLIGTGVAANDAFTDSGVAGDCTVAPPDESTTNATNSFTVNVPSAGQPAGAVNFCLYASTDGSFTSPALLGVYPVAQYDTDLLFTDITTAPGEPPAQSRCLPGANLIDPDTDMIAWPWKRPVATEADLPTAGNSDGDMRVTLDTKILYAWDAPTATWKPGGGAVGPAGPAGPAGPVGPQGPPSGATVITADEATDPYQLALTDAGTLIEKDGGTIEIPANSTVAFPVNTVLQICQIGATAIAITGETGVTVDAPGGLTHTGGQWATIGLRQRALNEWVLSGKLG
jgi:hypothetical protein